MAWKHNERYAQKKDNSFHGSSFSQSIKKVQTIVLNAIAYMKVYQICLANVYKKHNLFQIPFYKYPPVYIHHKSLSRAC